MYGLKYLNASFGKGLLAIVVVYMAAASAVLDPQSENPYLFLSACILNLFWAANKFSLRMSWYVALSCAQSMPLH
jgi:hypothetical protein